MSIILSGCWWFATQAAVELPSVTSALLKAVTEQKSEADSHPDARMWKACVACVSINKMSDFYDFISGILK